MSAKYWKPYRGFSPFSLTVTHTHTCKCTRTPTCGEFEKAESWSSEREKDFLEGNWEIEELGTGDPPRYSLFWAAPAFDSAFLLKMIPWTHIHQIQKGQRNVLLRSGYRLWNKCNTESRGCHYYLVHKVPSVEGILCQWECLDFSKGEAWRRGPLYSTAPQSLATVGKEL